MSWNHFYLLENWGFQGNLLHVLYKGVIFFDYWFGQSIRLSDRMPLQNLRQLSCFY